MGGQQTVLAPGWKLAEESGRLGFVKGLEWLCPSQLLDRAFMEGAARARPVPRRPAAADGIERYVGTSAGAVRYA